MSQQAAIRANQMVRSKLLEAAGALDRATVAMNGPHIHFTISLVRRDHIRGALLQALALTEQVEEELGAKEDMDIILKRGGRVLEEAQGQRQFTERQMRQLRESGG